MYIQKKEEGTVFEAEFGDRFAALGSRKYRDKNRYSLWADLIAYKDKNGNGFSISGMARLMEVKRPTVYYFMKKLSTKG